MAVIMPGRSPLRFEASSPFNEGMAVKLSSKIYGDILPANGIPEIDSSELNVAALQPLFSFAADVCMIGEVPIESLWDFEMVAQAVARSLLLSALGPQRNRITSSVYSMVEEYVAHYYSDQSIGVKDAARYVGISVRKLQAICKRRIQTSPQCCVVHGHKPQFVWDRRSHISSSDK